MPRLLAFIDKNNVVDNVIVMADEQEEFDKMFSFLEDSFKDTHILKECTDWKDETGLFSHVSVGWTWDGEKFISLPKGVDTITEEDLKRAQEMLERDQAEAARRIAEGLDAPVLAPGGTN